MIGPYNPERHPNKEWSKTGKKQLPLRLAAAQSFGVDPWRWFRANVTRAVVARGVADGSRP